LFSGLPPPAHPIRERTTTRHGSSTDLQVAKKKEKQPEGRSDRFDSVNLVNASQYLLELAIRQPDGALAIEWLPCMGLKDGGLNSGCLLAERVVQAHSRRRRSTLWNGPLRKHVRAVSPISFTPSHPSVDLSDKLQSRRIDDDNRLFDLSIPW
jgi:hypothetical protein